MSVGVATERPVELSFAAATPRAETRHGVEQVFGARICPACFQCRGELEVRGRLEGDFSQRCACDRDPTAECWEAWPGGPRFDFNRYLELCYCCGIETVRSGSRWSSFYCRECMDRVRAFNRRCGGWVIPIGRHSAMHGELLRGNEAMIEEHATHFLRRLRSLFAAIEQLEHWARARIEQNLLVLGFPAGKEIDLAEYLARAQHSLLDKELAFERLCHHFSSGPLRVDA